MVDYPTASMAVIGYEGVLTFAETADPTSYPHPTGSASIERLADYSISRPSDTMTAAPTTTTTTAT